MLAVLTLGFAMVAVVSLLADDLPEVDQGVGGGLARTVVCPLLALWMVRTFSRRHRDVQQETQAMNGDQWFALLQVGARGAHRSRDLADLAGQRKQRHADDFGCCC